MITLRVAKIGEDDCIVLDDDAKRLLGLKPGDTVALTLAPDGACRLTRCSAEFVRQMKLAEQVASEDKEVFQALVK